MAALETCPTEDAISALLDYLVDPVLLHKSSARAILSLSQQKALAKQVHAVVLLYNYYHRKQNPQLKFLDFDSFCKLAVILKPALLAYMKFMQRPDDIELDNLEKEISVTEKTIMDACDISTSLDASKEVPSTNGWPISKVAVLLVDSKVENCLLLFSAITKGVWSVIEKNMDVSNHRSGGITECKHISKKKKLSRKPLRDESSTEDSDFQHLAYSAVTEATGINQTDIRVLESHLVYSLSKEKTATHFYIMQYIQTSNKDVIQVALKDAIDSLRGPLLRKSSSRWTVTPVVKYYHMLPYVGIVSDWFSGVAVSSNLQYMRVGSGSINEKNSEKLDESCYREVHKHTDASNRNCGIAEGFANQIRRRNIESEQSTNDFSDAFDGPHHMGLHDSTIDYLQSVEKRKIISKTVQVDSEKEVMMISSLENSLNGSRSKEKPPTSECRGKKVAVGDLKHHIGSPLDDNTVVNYQSQDLDKLQNLMDLKENTLSKTALRILFSKRDKLSLQLRNIKDEIALCDRNIETIVNGGEDDFALKIESILEGCSDVCVRSGIQERTCQHREQSGLAQFLKKKKLSEAVLCMQNPCQELDGICYENNWVLPTYGVSILNGGFQANASVKGMDFECTTEGHMCSNPHEARESAAAKMMFKLRSMACVVE